jgi:hypothetical protein
MINFNIHISILGSTQTMDSMDIDQVGTYQSSYQIGFNKVSNDQHLDNMEIDTISYIPIEPYNMEIDNQLLVKVQLIRSKSCPL